MMDANRKTNWYKRTVSSVTALLLAASASTLPAEVIGAYAQTSETNTAQTSESAQSAQSAQSGQSGQLTQTVQTEEMPTLEYGTGSLQKITVEKYTGTAEELARLIELSKTTTSKKIRSSRSATSSFDFSQGGSEYVKEQLTALSESSGVDYIGAYNELIKQAQTFTLNNTNTVETWAVDLSDYKIPTDDVEKLVRTFTENNPQFFWLSGGVSWYSTATLTTLTFSVRDNFQSGTARSEAVSNIKSVVNSYLAGMADLTTDEECLEYINNRLCEDTSYDYNAVSDVAEEKANANVNDHNIVGALVDHLCVCDGYTYSFELLANLVGINTIYVAGTGNGGAHAWNVVQLDGTWYYTDVTWDDPRVNHDDGTSNEVGNDAYRKNYFMIGSTKLLENHVVNDSDTLIPNPEISADNYVSSSLGLDGETIDGETYYHISSASDLQKFADLANTDPSVCAILTADVDMSSVSNFTPMCSSSPYTGTFDGNGHSIKNLTISTSDDSVGLFANIFYGTVKNLTIASGSISSTSSSGLVGAIVGSTVCSTTGVTYGATIENCVNYADISGHYAGGLVGQGFEATVTGCANYGTVKGELCSGGIEGVTIGSDSVAENVENCLNAGTISTTALNYNYAGGIVGNVASNTTLTNCLNVGTANYAMASYISSGTCTANNCYSISTVTSSNVSGVTSVTESELADGTIAEKLGSGWGQNVGTDEYPIPGGSSAETFSAEIASEASMTISESYTYYFYCTFDSTTAAEIDSGALTPTMTVETNGTDEQAKYAGKTESGGKTLYGFSVELNAKNIADEMTPTLTLGDNVIVGKKTSAADYLTALYNSSSADDSIKEIARTALNYSANAQIYKGYNTDNLANANLSETAQKTASVTADDIGSTGFSYVTGANSSQSANPTFYAASLDMLTQTRIKVYFKLDEESQKLLESGNIALNYTYSGKTVSLNIKDSIANQTIVKNGSYYVYETDGFSPVNYGSVYKFTFSDTQSGSAIGDSVSYSVNSYIANMCASSDEKLTALVGAMYEYEQACKKYSG